MPPPSARARSNYYGWGQQSRDLSSQYVFHIRLKSKSTHHGSLNRLRSPRASSSARHATGYRAPQDHPPIDQIAQARPYTDCRDTPSKAATFVADAPARTARTTSERCSTIQTAEPAPSKPPFRCDAPERRCSGWPNAAV